MNEIVTFGHPSLPRKERKEAIKKIALNGFPGNDL